MKYEESPGSCNFEGFCFFCYRHFNSFLPASIISYAIFLRNILCILFKVFLLLPNSLLLSITFSVGFPTRHVIVAGRQNACFYTPCARFGCFNGSYCPQKRRSESSPRLQKVFTCACNLHAFCNPRLYAFSNLRSAGHCTGQS